MRSAFAGALLASAIMHAGVLLSPAPWVGEHTPVEGSTTQLVVRLQALPDLTVAETHHASGMLLDPLPAESRQVDALPALAVTPVFYKSSELDRVALPVDGIPQLAMLVTDRKHLWRLQARVFIDASGKVVKVELAGDQATTNELVEAVSATLTTLSFTPAVKDGKAVASQKRMDIVIGGELQ